MLIGFNQNGIAVKIANWLNFAFTDHKTAGGKRGPNPSCLLSETWQLRRTPTNVGQSIARLAYGSADVGGWQKRMLYCNDRDID